jgi:hypothetical protein
VGHLGREWAASLLTVVDTVGTGDGLEKEGVVEDRLRVSALAPKTETRQQTSLAWGTVAHSSHCTSENKWREAHIEVVSVDHSPWSLGPRGQGSAPNWQYPYTARAP